MSQNKLRIKKVLSLPLTWEPNTLYMVKLDEGTYESYMSSSDGLSLLKQAGIEGEYVPTAYIGVEGGVASLDETGKVPLEQLPELSGGGSSGINVIEYDPSLYEITVDTVTDADFVPVNGTCTYNTTTKEIEIAAPIVLSNIPDIYNETGDDATYNAEYVGVKLNNEFNAGELTIDVTNCTSNFGMVLIPPTMTLEDFLTNYHFYGYSYGQINNPVNPSEIFGRVGDTWGYRTPNGDRYSPYMSVNDSENLMSLTLTVGSKLAMYSQIYPDMTAEQLLSQSQYSGDNPIQPVLFDINTGISLYNIKEYDLYFFMLAHGDSGTTATLAPTDKLKITHTLSEKVNAVPDTAVDGDFLHIGENMIANNLLGRAILPSTFVQLYNNKTKMIIHNNQSDKVVILSGGGGLE